MRDYEKKRAIERKRSVDNFMQYYVWTMVAILAVGMIAYLVTDKALWLLCLPVGLIAPIAISLWIEELIGKFKRREARKEAMKNGESVYFCNNVLYLTENNHMVYFDRLTSSIYTWPERELVCELEFENLKGNFNDMKFSDIREVE